MRTAVTNETNQKTNNSANLSNRNTVVLKDQNPLSTQHIIKTSGQNNASNGIKMGGRDSISN